MSQAALARRLGTSPQFINNVLRGRKKISRDLAESLHRAFGYRLEWLLMGQEPRTADHRHIREGVTGTVSGEAPVSGQLRALSDRVRELESRLDAVQAERDALRSERADIIQIPDTAILRPGEPVGQDTPYVGVPLLSDAAAAGSPRVMEDQVDESDPYCVIHRRIAPRPADYRACWIEGDSMDPPLPSGSIVVVHLTERDPARLHGQMVAARIEGGVTVKHAYFNGPVLSLVPGNPDRAAHPIYTINMIEEPDAIIGRVVYAWCDYSSSAL